MTTRISRPVLRLRGTEVRRFANSLFTNNARDLPLGDHQQTAFCDDRGRLRGLADLVALAEDCFLLVLDGIDVESFCAEFKVHLMLEDIDVDETAEGFWHADHQPDTGVWWPCSWGGFLGVTETPLQDDGRDLDAARIAAGVPCFADASAKQLPHELGLRESHLHFEKGCYRGQETIHRIDVMGQVRKTLIGLRLSEDASGDTVELDGKRVGRVATQAKHPEHGRIALGIVRREHGPGTVLRCGVGTATVTSLPL